VITQVKIFQKLIFVLILMPFKSTAQINTYVFTYGMQIISDERHETIINKTEYGISTKSLVDFTSFANFLVLAIIVLKKSLFHLNLYKGIFKIFPNLNTKIMQKLSVIIFFFIFNLNSAQSIEFKYEYRLNYKETERKFGDFLNKNTDEFSKNMVNNLIGLYEFYQDNIFHTVIYDDFKSISFVNQVLPPDNFNEFQRNFIKSEINKIFFKDFSDSTFIKHESFLGKKYNIVTKEHKWKITAESKKNTRLCLLQSNF
jgi:hypothetical protein